MTSTKSLPAGAEIFTRKAERFARWKDKRGHNRTAPLTTGRDGSDRIVIETGTYYAKFRDGAGIVKEVATGCRHGTRRHHKGGDPSEWPEDLRVREFPVPAGTLKFRQTQL